MKTYNKLIAKFMGMEEERHLDGRYLFTTDLEELKGPDTRFTEELYFHISWDWLMPVVDKIEDMGSEIVITNAECTISAPNGYHKETMGKKRFGATYNAVVKFIIEYNKNK
tara:strand:+ start:3674 stop:4006 length:333 start_codon:yes stop_codon:yes gene_type:complete